MTGILIVRERKVNAKSVHAVVESAVPAEFVSSQELRFGIITGIISVSSKSLTFGQYSTFGRRVMKSRVLMLVMVGCGLAGVLRAEDTGAAVDQAWVKAMKTNSVDDVVACYADDAIAWFPGEPEHRGKAAIRASYTDWLHEETIQDAQLMETHYQRAGKLSVGWGTIKLTLENNSNGKTREVLARFTEVAEKRNGRWVYLVDHASAEPPPDPAVAMPKQ
ncbi:MAG TPA: nuclear transport factor 2 family protein [Verrucomicrobiae bacterium]|nr:nuclear transport factor 2 family protein [Verrucomicrobiae bacterium]